METISADQFRQKYGVQGVAKFSDTQNATQPSQTTNQPNTLDRVGSVIKNAGSNVNDAISGTGQYQGQNPVQRGVEATASAFNAVPQTAVAVAPKPVRDALGAVGNTIGTGFKALTDLIGSNPQLQKWTQDHPDATQALIDTAKTAEAGGQISSTILGAKGAVDTAQAGVDLAGQTSQKVASTVQDMTANAVDWGKNVQNDIKSAVGKKTVDPQLQASVGRLSQNGIEGASGRVENPVATYDNYLSKSKLATQDIKADPAIATVGEKIGTSFQKVIGQRKAVGAVMGDELKKFANNPVDIGSPVTQFQQDLIDSGATYDRMANQVTAGDTSKFTQTDVRLLQKYADDLSSLGKSPSAAKVDAFISRIPNEIKELKASGGVNTMTNAERIISKNLNAMRAPLSDVATPAYNTARTAYSNLSDFINEGGSYLGKITQSGDFAKDASIAKSAVQSILNNGKKDWLLKLEGLTGYNALDDSVLALQAMKDAGDFRGLSLLETLNEGTIPTSPSGLLGKVIQYGLNVGSKAVAGTPEEQTRAFLRSLTKPK